MPFFYSSFINSEYGVISHESISPNDLCVSTSKYLIDLVDKDHNIIMLMLSLAIYIIAYYFRMIHPIYTSVNVVNYIINALVLYGTSQLSYVVGLLFRKYFVMTKLKEKLNNKQLVGIILMLVILILLL